MVVCAGICYTLFCLFTLVSSMNKPLLWIGIIAAIALIIGGGFYLSSKRPPEVNVNTTNTSINSMVSINGTALNTNITMTNSTVNQNKNVNTVTTINQNKNVNTAPTVNTNTNVSALAQSASVSVSSSGFSPASVTIGVGGTVTWTNSGSSAVYVAPDFHPSHLRYRGIWDDDGTGNIGPGERYSFTFAQAGTYSYHDHLNPSRVGTVIVQ